MTHNAIRYAEENGITNRKGMRGFYRSLNGVGLPSCYKVGVITRACAVVESRRKSAKRGIEVSRPMPLKSVVCIISAFFITAKGRLFIPLRKRDEYADVLLNQHAQKMLAGKKLRSLTITPGSLSICYSDNVELIPIRTVYGVDRNEKNLTFGNRGRIVHLDMSETVRIKQTTREIVRSFKRPDMRVQKRLASKYWRRAANRTSQILHAATNLIVKDATENGAALALEDLDGMRRMYQRGNGHGRNYRFRLNSWPYWKAYRMLEYKSAWKGVTFIPLTRAETYGSSSECASCGERLHSPEREDAEHERTLWCQRCKVWTDRDVNAALNLSERGRSRFDRSLLQPAGRQQQVILLAGGKGLAGEAVMGNGTKTPILRVDASKLGVGHGPTVNSVRHGPST
jgi:putative transposase